MLAWMIVLTGALVVFGVVAHRRYRLARRRLRELTLDYDMTVNSLQHLAGRVAAMEAVAAGDAARAPADFRSRSGEDLFLYELFGGARRGFYIEAGAFDGLYGSLTSVFDALGWDGLLVEPHPELSAQAARNRPNARVVRAAVAERGSSGVAMFTALPSGNSYLSERGDVGAHRALASHAERYEVPLTTLDDLLARHDGPIDLCVFDVEGAERSLLDGFDLERFRPRVMLVEDLGGAGDDPGSGELVAYLGSRGYRQACWLFGNRLFVRADDEALLGRAARMAKHLATRG